MYTDKVEIWFSELKIGLGIPKNPYIALLEVPINPVSRFDVNDQNPGWPPEAIFKNRFLTKNPIVKRNMSFLPNFVAWDYPLIDLKLPERSGRRMSLFIEYQIYKNCGKMWNEDTWACLNLMRWKIIKLRMYSCILSTLSYTSCTSRT